MIRSLAAFAAASLLVFASSGAFAQQTTAAPDATVSAPAAAVQPPRFAGTYASVRSHWWAPAAISLGLTAGFDSLGIAGARANGPGANAMGGVSLLLGTASASAGWLFLLDNQSSTAELAVFATSGALRGVTLGIGWSVAGEEGLTAGVTCLGELSQSYCAQAAINQQHAANTFWTVTDVVIALSAVDIVSQFIFGALRDRGASPTITTALTNVVPAMLPADGKLAPGLAWAGKF